MILVGVGLSDDLRVTQLMMQGCLAASQRLPFESHGLIGQDLVVKVQVVPLRALQLNITSFKSL